MLAPITIGSVGGTSTTLAAGFVPPLTATTANTAIASVAVTGTSLTLTGNAVGLTTLVVRGADGTTACTAVSVYAVVLTGQ